MDMAMDRERREPDRQRRAADVVEEYRRLTRELGRFPTPNEFDRLAAMSFVTLRRWAGKLAEVREQMRGPEEARWDRAWLAEEWSRVRVACAARSSELAGREEPYDVAFVFADDWPECPAKVLSDRQSEAVRRELIGNGSRRRRPRRLVRATRAEILGAVQRMRARQANFSLDEFLARSGISSREMYLEFESWEKLRLEAGMPRSHRLGRMRIPDAVLLDEWVQVKQKIGKVPGVNEINRLSRFSHLTYYRRFGLQEEIVRRGEAHEQWRAYEAEAARERAKDPSGPWGTGLWSGNSRGGTRPPTAADVWAGLKVGFKLTSRGAADWDEHPRVLFCVQHDWPAYPGWVVEVREVRRGVK